MDTLTELLDYVVVKMNLAGEDSDVFKYILPDEPAEAIAIIPYGGSSTPLYTDTSVKSFQFVVRRSTHSKAYSDSVAIQKVLRGESDAYIKLDTMVCPIQIKDVPFKLKIDSQNRVLYAFNIAITSLN